MNTRLFGLLSETPVHVGAGESTGFLDLPVAREAATDYPVIPGSGLKGALRDLARSRGWDRDETRLNTVFGSPDAAGDLLFSDARLLLLPVRSLHGAFRWVTCRHLLERLERDTRRAGQPVHCADVTVSAEDQCLAAGDGSLFLEERQFKISGPVPSTVVDALRPLFLHPKTADRLVERLVVLHDDAFAWFARYGLMVSARNVLDEDRKTSKNLWYEEAVPPDSLFYTLVAERRHGTTALQDLTDLFTDVPYVQVGGNETVGHGVLAVQVVGNVGG